MAEVEAAAEGGAAPVSFADENEVEVEAADEIETSTAGSAAAAAPSSISHNELFAAVEGSVRTCRPVVDLFYRPASSDSNDGGGAGRRGGLTARQRRDAIRDVCRSPKFNRARARRLFAGLAPSLRRAVEEEAYLPGPPKGEEDDDDDDGGGEDEDEDDDDDAVRNSEASRAILFLRCCAFLVEAYLEGVLARQAGRRSSQRRQRIAVVDEAFEVAEMLHDSLFPLQSCDHREARPTQHAIFSMCEAWWHGDFEDKEQMVTQLIPLLLVKSLDDSATKADVRRLCSIRDAIDLLDFEDESILTVKTHLLRTAGSPLFLQCVDGRRFVAHLFRVDASLAMDLHRAVRAQIAGARKSILNAYAEIYYHAWKAAAEEEEAEARGEEEEGGGGEDEGTTTTTSTTTSIRRSIEENALQDLVYQVIHAAVPSTGRSVRRVLDRFLVDKKSPKVEAMLHRTYGPLLWRSLSSANSVVRRQAAAALADTFPLRDPEEDDEGEGRTRECVRRSVEALHRLMDDDVPSVRAAGGSAAARILREFWAAVPSGDIRTLLNVIIAKHASDASSSAVRAAAVNAITTLLEEEKTHGVLRPLLPSLGNLIHDKTEKVRLAVVNMLLVVKKTRGMKYYHVVPANHLLARLAEEGRGGSNPRGPVAGGLSELLGNSFFPAGRTMTDVVNRTLRLLSDNPGAAVAFYRNASSLLSVGSICRLIAALVRCLCFFVFEEKRRDGEDVDDLPLVFFPKEESIEYGGGSSDITALMATIAESVSILWESIESELKDSQNEDAEEMLMEVLSGNVLTEVYCHFEAKLENDDLEDAKLLDCFRACVAILNCAGKVDESKIEGLRSRIVDELSKTSDMPASRRTKANLSPNVALLCAWGMTEEVSRCLASSIARYFSGDAGGANTNSAASRTRSQSGKQPAVDGTGLPWLDIDVCLGILGHILKGSYPASVTARESILKSETAYNAIASALRMAQSAAERMIKPQQAADVAETCSTMIKNMGISIECYGRLLVHKEAMKGEIPMKLSPEWKSLMTWVTNAILPALTKLATKDGDNPLMDLDLSSIMGPESPGSNRNSSSPTVGNLGDTSFISARGSLNVFEDESELVSVRAAATTAAGSVLCTLAEWLSLRLTGEDFVSDQVAGWCGPLLERSDGAARRASLQLFLHVAVTSLRNEGDSALLERILSSLRNADLSANEVETISHAVALVISLRDANSLKAAIRAVVDVTRAIVIDSEERDEGETCDDSPLLDKVGPCMRTVIERVLAEKQSSAILARCLLDEPRTSSVRERLFVQLELRSPRTDALKEALREWEAENATAADEDEENDHVDRNDSETAAA